MSSSFRRRSGHGTLFYLRPESRSKYLPISLKSFLRKQIPSFPNPLLQYLSSSFERLTRSLGCVSLWIGSLSVYGLNSPTSRQSDSLLSRKPGLIYQPRLDFIGALFLSMAAVNIVLQSSTSPNSPPMSSSYAGVNNSGMASPDYICAI